MEPILLLKELEKVGVEIELLDNGNLHYKAPEGALDEDTKELLKLHKQEIIALLAAKKRFAKVKNWPSDLQSAHEKLTLTLMKRDHLDRAKAEERAFVYLKRPAAYLIARAGGATVEDAAKVFEMGEGEAAA